MAKPKSKPALTKAPRRSHPVAPEQTEQAAASASASGSPSGASTETQELVVFSARIPRELKRAVKATAAQRDQSVQELVVEALRRHLDTLAEDATS